MAAETGTASWQDARIRLFDDALDATERREAKRKEMAKEKPAKKKKPAIEFELEGNIEAEMRVFTNDVDMRDTYQLAPTLANSLISKMAVVQLGEFNLLECGCNIT